MELSSTSNSPMLLHLGLNISTYMYTAELDTKKKEGKFKGVHRKLDANVNIYRRFSFAVVCRKGHCQNSLNELILWAAQMKK